LEPPPAPARILAVPGVLDGAYFLFSGAELFVNEAGKTARRYLNDAYRFDPETGWSRIADLPRPAVAAPSPAFSHDGKLWIVSGDDGALVYFKPESKHPGFPKDVLAYDPHKNEWKSLADSPLSRATAPVINWRGKAIILSGEARPGRRTPKVWEMNFQ
jgi:N-acetylneuraminic acid mutarotase